MLKRTSSIYAKDSDTEIEITIVVKRRNYMTSNGSGETSALLKTIEDQVVAAVFTPRFFARNIKFSASPDQN